MPLKTQNIDQLASLRQLEGGGLPIRAALRLADEAGPHRKLFTTDLSVNEFLLTREINATPISQVMGSSIYHIPRIPDYKGHTGELESISASHREARRLALSRLWQEARLVEADAVVGVRLGERWITTGAHGKGGDDGDEIIEFTIVGTAVKMPQLGPEVQRPVVTDLSGQDLWALAREGYVPCGLVFDFCRYHLWHVLQNGYTSGGEISSATAAVEYAKRVVAERIEAQAKAFGSEFVVGSDITIKVHEVPCGFEGCALNDLDVDVAWFGTGVRRMAGAAQAEHASALPALVLGMMPLGKKKRGEIVEEEDESDELKKQAQEMEERSSD